MCVLAYHPSFTMRSIRSAVCILLPNQGPIKCIYIRVPPKCIIHQGPIHVLKHKVYGPNKSSFHLPICHGFTLTENIFVIVIFMQIESDEDILWTAGTREANEAVAARGMKFINW